MSQLQTTQELCCTVLEPLAEQRGEKEKGNPGGAP
jgi:hypothetical protein